MEKALAALHQALRPGQTLSLQYAQRAGQLGLAIRFPEALKYSVLGPLLANYPKAKVEMVPDEIPDHGGLVTWSAEVGLTPDLFPILRHSQFEDSLLHAYADPIDSLLAALKPNSNLHCELELVISPALAGRIRRAKRAVTLLERQLFERHKWLASWFTRQAAKERWNWRMKLLAWLAQRSAPPARETTLNISASHRHEREADLQAAADKLGGHLFAVSLRVSAISDGSNERAAQEKLHAIVAALGAFTRSRLATFSASKVRRGYRQRHRENFPSQSRGTRDPLASTHCGRCRRTDAGCTFLGIGSTGGTSNRHASG